MYYAVHIKLNTRSLNPCSIVVFIAFNEQAAYQFIDERKFPTSYKVYIKEKTK